MYMYTYGKGLRHNIRSNLKAIENSTFTDNIPLQVGTSFEHSFYYDLLIRHVQFVFKATINQSYCKYNTSLRQTWIKLFRFFKSTN